ncbi:hypothetical protein LTR53_005338 [Teratosphaeriaceae sp. CCFEE 6253]|nr:hypothetical protein LTR53_005338 [Teratosphaeriaceae sp. CCFEE 6253]
MSSYFSLPSFARAKQNKEQLEKTNPQNPVLKDEDEQFLSKHITKDEPAPTAEDTQPTQTTDSGEDKPAAKDEAEQAVAAVADDPAVPETQPSTDEKAEDGATEATTEDAKPADVKPDNTTQESEKSTDVGPQSETPDVAPEVPAAASSEPTESSKETPALDGAKDDTAADGAADDPPEQAPAEPSEKTETAKPKKSKKDKSFDLPSQEEAEAATKGFDINADPKTGEKAQGEKKPWTSYLPSIPSRGKKDSPADQQPDEKATSDKPAESGAADEKSAEELKGGQTDDQARRTWAEYASSAYSALPAIPSIPSIPSLPESWKSKDSKAEPVYKEDGTIDEEKTKEKQMREASVLLDRLNLSSINNRVFAFSAETEKIYERFTQVLKDTMNGAPTAYEDMEKLMKDAGPELEKQFASMPPFVQTLVKSLPAKLGTSMGPELLAMASEKPGGDMQARMKAASKQSSSGGDPSIQAASVSSSKAEKAEDGQKKQKRKIPGLKGLVSEQGMVASILRNVVSFLKVRFPFLASMTNVVMSLAVFILMFVFWYCHKRGKEVRLAQSQDEGKGEGFVEGADGEGELEVEVSDEEGGDEEGEAAAEKVAAEVVSDTLGTADADEDKTAMPETEATEGEGEAADSEAKAAGGEGEAAEPEAKAAEVKPIAQQVDSAEAVEEAAREAAPTQENQAEKAQSTA